jgi:phosphoserine/homoserine phosphotransferase
MWTLCFDCEGVLIPEIWLEVQRRTGLEELKITTREEPDYDKLMNFRIDVLKKNNIKLQDMRDAVAAMSPLPGAVEMLASLHNTCPRIVILTDTFENYAQPMFNKLGQFTVFCHSLQIDNDGFIEKHLLRLTDQKRKAVESLQGLKFKCIAIGDSFNDISMLKAAEVGILFRPSEKVKQAHPEFPVIEDHAELRRYIEEVIHTGKAPQNAHKAG